MNVWTNGWLHEENYTMGYNEKEWTITLEIKAKYRWEELRYKDKWVAIIVKRKKESECST